MTTWRCPIITEMGMCPETGIECPAHDPQCPHLPDELRPEMKEESSMTNPHERASDHTEVIIMDENEKIYCPRCRGEHFVLRRVQLGNRMLASARFDVICIGCDYRESLYKIGEDK